MDRKAVNLWGDEFVLPENTDKILSKIKKPKKVDIVKQLNSKRLTLREKLYIIEENVNTILGHYKEDTLVITTLEQLEKYIDKSIENGIIAVDTETNNTLNTITCKLMGVCLYTPGLKQTYIPINHISIENGERLNNQLTELDVYNQLNRLKTTKIIMHNGKFDWKVLHTTCKLELDVYWDTLIAARLLDENEISAGLKQQYIDKIDTTQEKYSIDHLFSDILYEQIDPNLFALYAATDAYMTYKLYEWQEMKFKAEKLDRLRNLLLTTEMPLMHVVAKMELRGISLDKEYSDRLSKKIHKIRDEIENQLSIELHKYKDAINKWELTPEANYKPSTKKGKIQKSKVEQLEDPINLNSPTQLAILLYDIIGIPPVDNKSPRGTGVDNLTKILDNTGLRLSKLMLEKRTIDKILSTFVDKLPEYVEESTGKIHAEFLQVGTDTGRFSSKNPNLQQLPRDKKEIRLMFRAREGYMLVGSDYSGQEARMAAHYSQDEDMIKAYTEDKDLYAVIASLMFKNNYEDNLAFYPEGTEIIYEGAKVTTGKKTHMNVEGNLRRQSAKAVLLGSLYGRGTASIRDQVNEGRNPEHQISMEEAQTIMDTFYREFPRLAQWMEECREYARNKGYVENWRGRRRRLPDAQLPKYGFSLLENHSLDNFNPLLGGRDKQDNSTINKYKELLSKAKYFKEIQEIKEKALKEGVKIQDNGGYISQAERQAVNFPCQSGGADLTKLAMIKADKDPLLNRLGFKLLLTIHDEIIGECPKENSEEAAKRLSKLMVDTATENNLNVPMKCDPAVTYHWYEDEVISSLNSELATYIEKGISREEAYNKIVNEHTELLESQIAGVLKEHKDYLFES